jgi:hypothetical protein
VKIVTDALGATSGEAFLSLAHYKHSGHNTMGRFAHDDVAAARPEQVHVETLDAIVRRLTVPRVDVIKIDVEGAEAGVVAGGLSTLKEMQPILLMEINDKALRAQGSSADELLATLRRTLGYEVLNFSATTGRLEPLTANVELAPNVVAAPRARARELLEQG